MQKSIGTMIRSVFALCLLAGGIYWFAASLQAWSQEGFIVFSNGETGKTALSGLIFSLAFILFGAMEMFKLFYEYKKKNST